MFAMQTGHISLDLSFGGLVRCLQVLGQAIKRAFPELAIFLDPLGRLFQRLRFQLNFMNPAVSPATQQAGFLEDAQMFGDRRERHGVRTGQIGDAPMPAGEAGEDPAASGIGQGGKGSIKRLWIFNHLVKY
jgi:hypothetical protein